MSHRRDRADERKRPRDEDDRSRRRDSRWTDKEWEEWEKQKGSAVRMTDAMTGEGMIEEAVTKADVAETMIDLSEAGEIIGKNGAENIGRGAAAGRENRLNEPTGVTIP